MVAGKLDGGRDAYSQYPRPPTASSENLGAMLCHWLTLHACNTRFSKPLIRTVRKSVNSIYFELPTSSPDLDLNKKVQRGKANRSCSGSGVSKGIGHHN